MAENMKVRLKQVRTLLFSYISFLPILILFISAIEYVIYIGLEYYEFPECMYKIACFIKQFNDMSLVGLILMFIQSKHFRLISKLSFICLCMLWLLNTFYIVFNFEADNYFYLFTSIIYVIFVIITLIILSKR